MEKVRRCWARRAGRADGGRGRRPRRASMIRTLRRDRGRAGADAGRRLDAALLAHARAGRSAGGRRGALDAEVGGQPRVVGRTREHLVALMGRRLDDMRLAALMLDGIELKGCCNVLARASRPGRERPARAVGRLHGEQDRRAELLSPTSSIAAWTLSNGLYSTPPPAAENSSSRPWAHLPAPTGCGACAPDDRPRPSTTARLADRASAARGITPRAAPSRPATRRPLTGSSR